MAASNALEQQVRKEEGKQITEAGKNLRQKTSFFWRGVGRLKQNKEG